MLIVNLKANRGIRVVNRKIKATSKPALIMCFAKEDNPDSKFSDGDINTINEIIQYFENGGANT